MQTALNTRVLVVDDEEIVRDSIREVLTPRKRDMAALDLAASSLFDDDDSEVAPAHRRDPVGLGYEIDLFEAENGFEALEKIRAAAAEGAPFAVVFLDMRMPGWDGLETAKKIREIDRAAEIVFVTAYSDRGIDEIVAEAGSNVGFHCKPFASEEIRQIAAKGIYDWNKIHNLETLIECMGRLRSQRAELEPLLRNILHQIADWVSARSALLARGGAAFEYTPLVGFGCLGDPGRAKRLLERLGGRPVTDVRFPFEGNSYQAVAEGDIVVVWREEGRINTEKLYLLRLFVEHAAQMIENAELHEQLLLGEKLSAIGRAVGSVAHDLRSPIGAVQSALDVARMDLDDREQVVEMLDLAGQSAEDAMSLTADILDFTKRATVEMRLFHAPDLMDRVRRRVQSVATTRGVDLSIECDAALQLIGDQRKLARVLVNLVVNAAEALASRPAAAIAIAARGVDETARITVADNGPGVPERIRATLFEPFVTHGKAEGTGLGLAIAKQIVEAHGGTLSFKTGDEGTTFLIQLPRPEKPAPPSSPEHAACLEPSLAAGG